MANYSVSLAKHATLVPGVPDTITLAPNTATLEVFNRGDGDLFFTVNGAAPTVLGDNCIMVRPGSSFVTVPRGTAYPVVQLIADTAVTYSVSGA